MASLKGAEPPKVGLAVPASGPIVAAMGSTETFSGQMMCEEGSLRDSARPKRASTTAELPELANVLPTSVRAGGVGRPAGRRGARPWSAVRSFAALLRGGRGRAGDGGLLGISELADAAAGLCCHLAVARQKETWHAPEGAKAVVLVVGGSDLHEASVALRTIPPTLPIIALLEEASPTSEGKRELDMQQRLLLQGASDVVHNYNSKDAFRLGVSMSLMRSSVVGWSAPDAPDEVAAHRRVMGPRCFISNAMRTRWTRDDSVSVLSAEVSELAQLRRTCAQLRAQAEEREKMATLNGFWTAVLVSGDTQTKCIEDINPPLRQLCICNGRVVLADGSRARIEVRGDRSFLCGGEVRLENSMLVRRGKGGTEINFMRRAW